MCNAWNHPVGCNCGWGGYGYGGRRGGIQPRHEKNTLNKGIVSQSSETYTQYVRKIVFNSGVICFIVNERIYSEKEFKDLIYEAKCWHCGEDIYVYSNSFGSVVLFEEIGRPWTKHNCNGYEPTIEQYPTVTIQKNKSKIEKQQTIPLKKEESAFIYVGSKKNYDSLTSNSKLNKKLEIPNNENIKKEKIQNQKFNSVRINNLELNKAQKIAFEVGLTLQLDIIQSFMNISGNYKELKEYLEKYKHIFK